MADSTEPKTTDTKKSKLPAPPEMKFNWQGLAWYVATMLLILWMWQEMVMQTAVNTIPYSEFKQHVAARQVTKCDIRDDEIIGTIQVAAKPEPAPIPTQSKPAAKPTLLSEIESEVSALVEPEAVAKPETSDKPEASDKPESSTKPESSAKPELSDKPEASAKPEGKTAAPPTNPTSVAKPASTPQPTEMVFRTVRVDDPKLVDELEAAGVEFEGVRPSILSNVLLSWILPMGIVFVLWTFLSRRFATAGQSLMGIGQSRAKLVGEKSTGVSFSDVAGCDEAKFELQEVVDFLKHPESYVALGAKIPKGVLLVGPPATGKTLMARAVAGEAEVPFYSLSGSDFVEMFVGVGASRVRDLFKQATLAAPCIVFIDELDAIGRERGVHMGAVNDEREQTLNQLLVEMDGFQANVGVILLAATNRPEVLDHALLRPGRFDRQVIVDLPDIAGRLAILKVHSRNKPLEANTDLQRIAQATPGFSGADLANVLNEAALMAARLKTKAITQANLEEAVEKVVAGPERKSRHE